MRWVMAAVLGVSGGAVFPPAAAQAQERVTCESRDGREGICSSRGASDVRLVEQLSNSPCRPDRDWTYDRQSIRVRNGCRAVFALYFGGGGGGWGGGNGNGGTRTIRCESFNYREQYCRANLDRATVQVQRVLGGTCRQNDTWRWDRNGINVRNGCRADFRVTEYGGGGSGWGGSGGSWEGGGSGGRIVSCASQNYRYAQCYVGTINNVQIDRVQGGRCVRNETWGVNSRNIWVDQGCRAQFRVY